MSKRVFSLTTTDTHTQGGVCVCVCVCVWQQVRIVVGIAAG